MTSPTFDREQPLELLFFLVPKGLASTPGTLCFRHDMLKQHLTMFSSLVVAQRLVLTDLALADVLAFRGLRISRNECRVGYVLLFSCTVQFCYDYCLSLGARWMSTQWATECWCAEEEDLDYERHGEGTDCELPCAGDAV